MRRLATLAVVMALTAEVFAAPADAGVAVIIGNRNYDNAHEVRFAHRDADAFRRYVTDVLGFGEDRILDYRDATLAELLDLFGREGNAERTALWSLLDVDGNSDVVLFYSGHGMPGSDGRGYLLPVDGHPARPELNGYAIETLERNLASLDARSFAVYLDACFSGSSHTGALVSNVSGVYREAPLPDPSGDRMVVLTAASATETAFWDEDAGHGMFTHHLLDALYGAADADANASVTAREAHAYVRRRVAGAVRLAHRDNQSPSLRGASDRVLAFAPGGRYPLRPALAGNRFRDCPTCPEMTAVPAGRFRMGCHSTANDCFLGLPPRDVQIARAYALSVHEVTRGEFRRFVVVTGHPMGACRTLEGEEWQWRTGRGWLSPGFAQTDGHPAVCVSWDDASAYAAWLSRETGQAYRLPTEAEWEYAARAGSTTMYHSGNDESTLCRYANHGDATLDRRIRTCSDGVGAMTAPVASFEANGLGIHDMLGNASEWVADCWSENYAAAPTNGSAQFTDDCAQRVLRGGSWFHLAFEVSVGSRHSRTPGNRESTIGFRVARTIDTSVTTEPDSPVVDLPIVSAQSVSLEDSDVLRNARAEAPTHSSRLQESARAIAEIRQSITDVWSRPESARAGMQVKFSIELAPSGHLSSIVLVESSGNVEFDYSAERAVRTVGRFTVPADRDLFERRFRRITLLFKPEDLPP